MKEPKKIIMFLPVQLTDEEKTELARGAADLQLGIEEVEAQQAAANKRAKGEVETKSADMRMKLKTIRDGYENRQVECVTRFHDPTKGFKTTYRLDEVLERQVGASMRMTENELQEELEFAEAETNG